MHILRLLASTITAAATSVQRRDGGVEDDDEGPFFDLDFSSLRASSSSSGSLSLSDSDSDDSCEELDFIISLQRSRSASPLCFSGAPQLNFCASEPPARPNIFQASQQHGARKRGSLRTLSFGARKAAPLYVRPSLARSSSFRQSFARISFSSARSLGLSVDSPSHATEGEAAVDAAQNSKRAPSRDVMRRYLARISRRLRTSKASPRASAAAEARGLRRLRKCRSASSAAPRPSSVARCDDSAIEKQDGIAGAIAHCKDSLHRASTSERDSPLLRSRSDPGKCEAAA